MLMIKYLDEGAEPGSNGAAWMRGWLTWPLLKQEVTPGAKEEVLQHAGWNKIETEKNNDMWKFPRMATVKKKNCILFFVCLFFTKQPTTPWFFWCSSQSGVSLSSTLCLFITDWAPVIIIIRIMAWIYIVLFDIQRYPKALYNWIHYSFTPQSHWWR